MRRYFAEFLATFFLVFIAVGAIVADQQLAVVLVRDSFGPLGVALAQGLALAMAIAAVARISGGYANPAVSLALFVTGRLSAKDLMGYVAAQFAGAAAAALLVGRLFVADAVNQAGVGATALGDRVGLFQGLSMEIVLTFLLVLVIWGVGIDRQGHRAVAPFAIGLTLTIGILVAAPFTGGAMNPARWFGSAVASGQFRNWQVWLAGPIVGALLAALLYESFFLSEDSAEAARQALDAEEDRGPDGDRAQSPLPAEPTSPMTPPEVAMPAAEVPMAPPPPAPPPAAPASAPPPPRPTADKPGIEVPPPPVAPTQVPPGGAGSQEGLPPAAPPIPPPPPEASAVDGPGGEGTEDQPS